MHSSTELVRNSSVWPPPDIDTKFRVIEMFIVSTDCPSISSKNIPSNAKMTDKFLKQYRKNGCVIRLEIWNQNSADIRNKKRKSLFAQIRHGQYNPRLIDGKWKIGDETDLLVECVTDNTHVGEIELRFQHQYLGKFYIIKDKRSKLNDLTVEERRMTMIAESNKPQNCKHRIESKFGVDVHEMIYFGDTGDDEHYFNFTQPKLLMFANSAR